MCHDAQFVIDFNRSYMDVGVLEFEVIVLISNWLLIHNSE